MTHDLVEIRDRAARAIRTARSIPRDEATPYLREAAERFVDARALMLTPEGEPDWSGRSWEYRRWIGDVMGAAGVAPGDRAALLSAIRHHVSNVLHTRLDEDTLVSLGLRPIDARERSVEKRARQSRVLSAFRGGPRLDDPEVVADALQRAETMLRRIDTAAMQRAEEASAVRAGVRALLARTLEVDEALAPKGRAAAAVTK